MSDSPLSRRWTELVSMLNTDAGLNQVHLEYLRIAGNASASAFVVLAATPVHMAEAILNREFPPQSSTKRTEK